jgi:hypothetical protein
MAAVVCENKDQGLRLLRPVAPVASVVSVVEGWRKWRMVFLVLECVAVGISCSKIKWQSVRPQMLFIW